jgi:hypothetical protein
MSRTHLAVGVAGVLAGCAAAAALVWGGYPTSPATLVAAVLLSLGVGWSFVFVGLAATVARPDSRVGWLMVLAGFAGLARAVAAVDTRLAFVLGIAVEDVVYAMAAHLLVAFPGGRLRTATDKAVIGFTYALTAPFGLLVYFTLSGDSDCSSCRENIAVPRHGGGELSPIALFIHPAVIVVCVVVLWLMHRRWQRATPALRRSLTPALLGGALFIATIAVQRIGILLTPPEAVRVLLGWASHVALIFFPLGLLTGLVRSRLDRSGVADLAVAMSGAAGPQALRAALARALHDPSLQVGYWLPDRQAFVDDAGAPLDLAQRTARSMTVLQRTASRWRRCCTTSPSQSSARCSKPWLPPPGWPWRTSACTPPYERSWPRSAPRAPGSSPPETRSAGGSSATCTTARSRACSACCSRCAW